jgi:beta-galactosidase/beta-glucuronidase
VARSHRRTGLAALAASLALAAGPLASGGSGGAPESAPAQATPLALSSWTFRLDAANRGLARGWQQGTFGGATVRVPHAIDAVHYKGPAGERNYNGSIAWYRTTFTAAQAGTYALKFASANFRADVWVDGHTLTTHIGSYLPFEARAPLAVGQHAIVVRIDWRDPAMQSRLGFHRTWFNWGGLDGAVGVQLLGASELSQASVQTTLTPNSPHARSAGLRIGVRLRNNGPARTLAVQGTLSRREQTVPISFPPVSVQEGETVEESTSATVDAPELWSPSHPALYELSLAVPGESTLSARVGLRQLSWRGGRVYLNGRRLRLHGASLQEDAPGHGDALTASDEDTFVKELKAIGANGVRSQHPLTPGLLDRLDAAGVLVWQGIGPVEGAGNWYSTTPALVHRAELQALGAVLAARLHPSIVAWNLVDEVAGNGRDGAELAYVRGVSRWLHAHDPTRMVAVDVWGTHPPKRAGQLYAEVDAVAETDYTGWYDSPLASPAQQVAMMRTRLAAMHRTFPGKVLVISEFGAEANSLNPPAAPGGYAFQSALLARHIDMYASDPQLSGMLIWDLRDYPLIPAFQGGSIHFKLPHLRLAGGLIEKGLYSYGGTPKPAVRTVARMFKALPAD